MRYYDVQLGKYRRHVVNDLLAVMDGAGEVRLDTLRFRCCIRYSMELRTFDRLYHAARLAGLLGEHPGELGKVVSMSPRSKESLSPPRPIAGASNAHHFNTRGHSMSNPPTVTHG